ncbi:MAG: hypothetical protein J7L90_01720 [Dehalococcoidia bacterium]|nr:hypothetical protein [Dehalococcoidia bacterium]
MADKEKNKEKQGSLRKIIKELFDWNIGCGSCCSCSNTNLRKITDEAENDNSAKTCKNKSDSGEKT